MRNYGVDISREEQELKGDEWVFGAASPVCAFSVPLSVRKNYLPEGERQNIGEEKMGCVSRGYINILETKFQYALRTSIISEEGKEWLFENGYITSTGLAFSDAFIEILSGTTRQGNSMKAPADAIRKFGLIPKVILPQLESWDDHHNPDRITPDMLKLGQEFLKRFPIGYEQVPLDSLENVLHTDMVNLAGHAWPKPIEGEYPRTEGRINHAFMGYDLPMTYIMDNYLDEGVVDDWIKKLAKDFVFYKYGYRVFVIEENVIGEEVSETKQTWREALLAFFRKLLCILEK